MTVHVSVCSISAFLLLRVNSFGLPGGAPGQSVVAPQKGTLTFAGRLDRLAAQFDRNRIERVERGGELAPATFTLQPSTESGWGK
jgi:hypothetical protein